MNMKKLVTFKIAVSDRLKWAFTFSAKLNEPIRSCYSAVALTRLRVERIVIITSLLLICGSYGESAHRSSAYEDCIAQKTKSASDESEEVCTQFLSDAGQRRARELCPQSERPAAHQAPASTDSSPQPLWESSRSDPLISPRAEKQPEGSRSPASKKPQQRQRKETFRSALSIPPAMKGSCSVQSMKGSCRIIKRTQCLNAAEQVVRYQRVADF
jgi:hypothetical protein